MLTCTTGNANCILRIHESRNMLLFHFNYIVCNKVVLDYKMIYEGWNFNSGNYLFTTDTK